MAMAQTRDPGEPSSEDPNGPDRKALAHSSRAVRQGPTVRFARNQSKPYKRI
jgi:hypothetical protein